MDIQKRFDRIIAIYIQLQSKPIVKAQELADKFDVSLRTIYRDLKSLASAGVPIYGEAGIGYSLMQGYKLAPVMFNQAELLSFVAAEKIVPKYLDAHLSTHFLTALTKMKAMLRHTEKEQLADITHKITYAPNAAASQGAPLALQNLLTSIGNNHQVAIAYLKPAAEKADNRIIEPIGVYHEHGQWYVMAYCLERAAYRNFRVDRIQQIKESTQAFSMKHPRLEHLLAPKDEITTEEVSITVDMHTANYMTWERQYFGFSGETKVGAYVKLIFKVQEPYTSFVRWLLLFADGIVEIEPPHIKASLQQLLQNMQTHSATVWNTSKKS